MDANRTIIPMLTPEDRRAKEEILRLYESSRDAARRAIKRLREELGMPSLGEEYPKEQARLRRCLANGREIGPAGIFYCTVIEEILVRADKAAIEGDLPAMIEVYKEMKEISE